MPGSEAFGEALALPGSKATGESFEHLSVMLPELVDHLAPRSGGTYVDATLGGGGHAAAVLERSQPDGRLIGIDRDPKALTVAGRRLEPFASRLLLTHGCFSGISGVLERLGIDGVDGVYADLGVSSPQLDHAERGFSFNRAGPLDMRMDPGTVLTAADLVNEGSIQELTRIFREYGEERYAARVARAIAKQRKQTRLDSTLELAELVSRVLPREKGPKRIHPATRVFQALRIAVNDELGELEAGLDGAFSNLRQGGRLVVISFHSLEDRIVKRFFRAKASSCVCPPRLPVCICTKVSELRLLTPKPIGCRPEEAAVNPRARSARLRAAEKIIAHSD